MAKKEKKISVNELERAVGDILPHQTEIEWNGLKFLVRYTLPLEDMVDFVNSVTASCFNTEDFSFHPEWVDFVTRTAVVVLYTNLTLPRNHQKVYDILYGTQLYNTVLENINQDQFDELTLAINKKIRFMEHSLTTIAGSQMLRIANSMEELEETLGSMTEGIKPDDLRNFVNAMSNGLDEQKLAQAVLQERNNGRESIA